MKFRNQQRILKNRIEPRFRGKKVHFYEVKPKYNPEVQESRLETDALGGISLTDYKLNKDTIKKFIEKRDAEGLRKFIEENKELTY